MKIGKKKKKKNCDFFLCKTFFKGEKSLIKKVHLLKKVLGEIMFLVKKVFFCVIYFVENFFLV